MASHAHLVVNANSVSMRVYASLHFLGLVRRTLRADIENLIDNVYLVSAIGPGKTSAIACPLAPNSAYRMTARTPAAIRQRTAGEPCKPVKTRPCLTNYRASIRPALLVSAACRRRRRKRDIKPAGEAGVSARADGQRPWPCAGHQSG